MKCNRRTQSRSVEPDEECAEPDEVLVEPNDDTAEPNDDALEFNDPPREFNDPPRGCAGNESRVPPSDSHTGGGHSHKGFSSY
ncbi:hypothetical protein StoSoilA2_32580 [Arthrobacter sp. StoSoilA2]|nr:hypothetical protein StoSoilA2_32580 [Arthrobacter sp. StoSoilA2]